MDIDGKYLVKESENLFLPFSQQTKAVTLTGLSMTRIVVTMIAVNSFIVSDVEARVMTRH